MGHDYIYSRVAPRTSLSVMDMLSVKKVV